ncbi:DUF350 domain-containing protein [Conexibacter sp. SYSU D00693]|uniref:DUF350 domain-containing protein n=1 Tax=Conexibacter sp. SYSU D00693 TaxID=2812560 RepID=UPI00196ABE6A|nr:DUF350 domain-containing protein [Conexibacter sp. SYSU D00693]
MDLQDFAHDLLAGLLYGGVGIALMMAGFMVLDMLTPGKLAHLIVHDRRRDAGIVVAAGFLAVGAIVTSAILASEGDLDKGLAETAGFGAVGLILLAVAFVSLDRLMPAKLGEILADEHEDPAAAYVTGAALVAVGAMIAAAIS